MASSAWLGSLVVVVGCGSAPPPLTGTVEPVPSSTASASPALDAPATPAEAAPAHELPTECASKSGDMCTPPLSFVKRLCAGYFPDVALKMFSRGTPWTRGYLARNVEAWNASGGASSNDKLEFDEEVLVLYHRAADAGGMQVSGSGGGYDVLRWDGTCASLSGEELTLKPPPRAKQAKVPWKSLADETKKALLADEKIGKVDAERRKECKGVSMGDVSLKCVKADARQSALIVDYVRNGGSVPDPEKLP